MKSLARLGSLSLFVTYLHLVFGGIVRITGSGMGCGDHWPKCNGQWIPPLDNPLVMIEWTHRLLATLVILAIGGLAFRRFVLVRISPDPRSWSSALVAVFIAVLMLTYLNGVRAAPAALRSAMIPASGTVSSPSSCSSIASARNSSMCCGERSSQSFSAPHSSASTWEKEI